MKEKTIKRIAIFSLTTLLLVSGCSPDKTTNKQASNSDNFYYESTIMPSTPSQSATNSVDIKTSLSEEELKLLEQETSLSELEYSKFISDIHSLPVEYENSEYFQIQQAFSRYENIKEYDTESSNFIKDGKVDEEALRKKVIENNNNYFANKKSGKYSLLDNATFEKVFRSLIDSINYNLQYTPNIDIAQLDDNLTNLRIFRMTTPGSGMVTDDAIVAVNLEVIATRQSEYPNVDYLRMTVLHEGNHFVQASSVKEREQEGYSKNVGVAYAWDDLAVNPLFYTWYTESSAEHLKLYQYGDGAEITTYENQVKGLEMMTLATLPKEGVDSTSLAKVSLQPNLTQLFTIFNCQTKEEQLEVLNMMYAMEICYNQPTEFSKFYKEQTGQTLEIYNYQDSLKGSIAKTLTKNFYENLATYLSKGKSVKDIFSMITTFEVEMARFTRYTNTEFMDTNESFLSMYREIQEEFFSLLSENLNMNVEEITSLYNTYYHDEISNISQSDLSSDSKDFINKLLQSRNSNKKSTIAEMGISKTK